MTEENLSTLAGARKKIKHHPFAITLMMHGLSSMLLAMVHVIHTS